MDGRMIEPTGWLKANRCGHCVNRCQPLAKYGVRVTHDGWKCNGYRSKHWDERFDFKEARA